MLLSFIALIALVNGILLRRGGWFNLPGSVAANDFGWSSAAGAGDWRSSGVKPLRLLIYRPEAGSSMSL